MSAFSRDELTHAPADSNLYRTILRVFPNFLCRAALGFDGFGVSAIVPPGQGGGSGEWRLASPSAPQISMKCPVTFWIFILVFRYPASASVTSSSSVNGRRRERGCFFHLWALETFDGEDDPRPDWLPRLCVRWEMPACLYTRAQEYLKKLPLFPDLAGSVHRSLPSGPESLRRPSTLPRRTMCAVVEERGGEACDRGGGVVFVPVPHILEHVVEVVALSELSVVERIPVVHRQSDGHSSCSCETGTHSAHCAENLGIPRWVTSLWFSQTLRN